MGSFVELNDTLQITTEQGFPADRLRLDRHQQSPYTVADFEDETFFFANKPGARIFHRPPTRNYLVHNVEGRWLHWGHVLMTSQTIDAATNTTSGAFQIIKIYTPDQQRFMSTNEVPSGAEFVFP